MTERAIECRVGFSGSADPSAAAEEACAAAALDAPDLAIAFVSSAHGRAAESMATRFRDALRPRAFLGCTVQGTIATGVEIESGPSVVLFAARLPGARLSTFHVAAREAPDGFVFDGLPDAPAEGSGEVATLLFPDPFTSPVTELLSALDRSPVIVGGVASGASMPGGNRLFRDGEVHRGGTVGVLLEGARVRPLVSQGCRPIGRPFVITKANGNLVEALAGKPAAERLKEVFEALPEADRALARRGLQLGLAMEERRERHGQGDFLIRGLMGLDPETKAIAVSDHVRVGQTAQFQVRDGPSAKEEFARLLREFRGEAKGALLFSCNGRGRRLFREADADALAMRKRFGELPLAGFFAAGEIGPVAGRAHLHGFTASAAIFCAPA